MSLPAHPKTYLTFDPHANPNGKSLAPSSQGSEAACAETILMNHLLLNDACALCVKLTN